MMFVFYLCTYTSMHVLVHVYTLYRAFAEVYPLFSYNRCHIASASPSLAPMMHPCNIDSCVRFDAGT
jgi:hypothetical protein